jgi:flagellar export protein FliJ
MKPRSCWSVLTKKAKDDEEVALQAQTEARKRVEHLQASRQRMDDLLNDYKRRALENQAKLHSMADTTNNRQFMLQLQELVSRVDKDLVAALAAYERAKQVLLQATHQRMKMETMQDKDLAAVQQWHRQREQKEMDALGLTLYNLKA